MHDLSPSPDVESSSDVYARRFAGKAGRFFLRRQERICRHALQDKRAVSVLDVGGGHAQLSGVLVGCGHKVTVTGSAASCSARLRLDPRNRSVTFVRAPLDNLPFEDRRFDTVVAIRMMAHVPDWRRFLSELCRVSDRSVVVDYPDRRSLNGLSDGLFGLKQRIEGDTRRYRTFRVSEIREGFVENGFRIAFIGRQFLLPMALHRAAKGTALLRGLEWIADRVGLTGRYGNPGIVRADRIEPSRAATRVRPEISS